MSTAGRYRLEVVIGVGSFATVHRAVDDRLDSRVVIKMLAENHSLNPEIRARFIAEGRSLRKVNDPHVVTVHDIGESERQQPYLVLEYADRGTLADRVEALRARGWVASAEDVLTASRNLTSALHAVHAAGLVHRDLSPRNVLITRADRAPASPPGGHGEQRLLAEDEILVVADLGMCKDLALNSGLTVAGGTAGFRPPEQESGPALIDHRADLWAMSKLLEWIAREAPLPAAFDAELRRSLQPDPSKRHPGARAWLESIEAALAPPPAHSRATATGARPRHRWRNLAAVVVLALALGAGALLPTALAHLRTGEADLAIEGPQEITVGQEATYRAVIDGAESWVWILPGGRYVADADTVSLTPSSPGRAEVALQARDENGNPVEERRSVVVETAE